MDGFTVKKHGHSRFWAVYDPVGDLVCVCVYKRGAVEVVRRLSRPSPASASELRENPPETAREPVQERSKDPAQG